MVRYMNEERAIDVLRNEGITRIGKNHNNKPMNTN